MAQHYMAGKRYQVVYTMMPNAEESIDQDQRRRARKLNQNGKQSKANCKGKKQEKEANKETLSATNEKREIALEWANERQARCKFGRLAFAAEAAYLMCRHGRNNPFHSFLVSGH